MLEIETFPKYRFDILMRNSFKIRSCASFNLSKASSLSFVDSRIKSSIFFCNASEKLGTGNEPTIVSVINGCTPPVAYFQNESCPILEER